MNKSRSRSYTDSVAILDDLKELQAEIDRAKQAKARAEAERDAAWRRKKEILARLQDEFGLESLEAAEEEIERLGKSIEDEVSRLRALLIKEE